MAYSRDPSAYPREFAQLFERGLRESFEIDVGDFGFATSFVHRLHAYRRAVESAKTPGWQTLRNVTIKVRGTRVLFECNEAILSVIRAAVGKEPSDTELEEYLAKAFEPGDNSNGRSISETTDREQEVRDEGQEESPVREWQDLFGIKKA